MILKLSIWFFALILSLLSGAVTMGAISKSRAPQIAMQLPPVNGYALEKTAMNQVRAMIIEQQGQFPDTLAGDILGLAQRAYESEPVTPGAIALLAMGKPISQERALMNEAYKLSRREQLINGWMITDSGAREDVAALLKHYDTTIRTNASTHMVLTPIMADALENEYAIDPFSDLLLTNPPWRELFWKQVVQKPGSLQNAVLLRGKMLDLTDHKEAGYDAELIVALIKNKQFDESQKFYRRLSKNAKSRIVKNSSFEQASKYQPIDWQLFSTGEYGATIDDGDLNLNAIRNSGGIFARQLVEIPKRTVRADVQLNDNPAASANLFLSLSCAEDIANKPQRIRISLKEKSVQREIDNSNSSCDFYWLDITGRASENSDGFDVTVKSVNLISM